MTPLLLVAALGCTDDTTGPTGVTDTSDTPAVTDTDTGDPDTTSGDTEDTAEPSDSTSEPDPGELRLFPRELTVDPGASWGLRSVHTLDGLSQDVVVHWESADPAIVTILDGVATAVAPGSATLSARYGNLVAHASVTVQAEPVMRLQLVDALTRAPLTGGQVHCAGETAAADPITGVASVPAPAGQPLDCTVWTDADEHIPLNALQLVTRDVVLPLRTRGQQEPDSEIEGTFDFSNLPPLSDDEKAAGWVVLGMAGSSLRQGPLFWRADEVLSPDRIVELYGLEVEVPGNLAIHEYFEEWVTPAWSGDAGIWSMAGPVPLADAILGLSNLDEALDFLLDNFDGFVYGYAPGLTVPADSPLDLEVAPATSLSDVVQVDLPDWPEGYASDNPVTLIALDGDGVEGPAVVGFGRGFPGEHHLTRVPGSFFGWDGTDSQVLAYLEVDGLGSVGARSLRVAEVIDGVAVVGPLQEAPTMTAWDEDNLLLHTTVDPRADVVTLYVHNKNNKQEKDYVLPWPDGPVFLPWDGPEMSLGTITFEVSAVETTEGTFESLIGEGAVTVEALEPIAESTSFVTDKFKEDSRWDP